MNLRTLVSSATLLAVAITTPLLADEAASASTVETTTINVAGHPVPVPKNGLYDRFRSNPPLQVIAQESPETDLSWFKTLEKTRVDAGFETWSPNFYYENSMVTAVFTADIERLRELMPADVLAEVQPLQLWPGRGLVALTGYAYHYCDNDRYNEIALSIVTNAPGKANLGPITLGMQVMSKDLWGYVLKLPVDTELARVRGVVGYNLPKWKTRIDYSVTDSSVVFEIFDENSGKRDFTLTTAKLEDVSDEPQVVQTNFVNPDQNGKLVSGYSQTSKMQYGSSLDGDDVSLELTNGSFSKFIKTLDLGKMMQYQYVPSFQLALYTPRPIAEVK